MNGLRSRRRTSRGRRLLGALAVFGLLTGGASALAAPAGATAPGGHAGRNAPRASARAAEDGIGTQAALARASASGKAVAVTSATTATSTVTANPNGTLTVRQFTIPVRKKIGGKWKGLDPTLRRTADGRISPAVSTGGIDFSPGGSGPLATMSAGTSSLSFTLPMRLPAPRLSGATATYPDVLDGVDLSVTADEQGGFSEVLVVKDAAAAADPELRSLTLATKAHGVRLSADATGNVAAKDRTGRPVFTATAPRVWDSATDAAAPQAPTSTGKSAAGDPAKGSAASTSAGPPTGQAVTDPLTGTAVDAASGLPLRSSPAAPGEHAHTAALKLAAKTAGITLTPPAALLGAPSTVYPVYIDPTFTAPSASSSLQAWTQTNSYYHSASYWKSGDLLRVGYQDWQEPTFKARSFVQISVPSKIYGATVLSSQLNFTEEWSPSCTATGVQLWKSSGISSGTTYDNPPTLSSEIDSATVAHGHDSSCPAAGVGFDIGSAMQSAATAKSASLTFGLRASDESDAYGWKEFSDKVSVSTTYDHAPTVPNTMSTSPVTSCTTSTVGDGDVTLHVKASDPDGGTVGVAFSAVNHATGATVASSSSGSLTASSGSTFSLKIPKATLESTASIKALQIDWKAQDTDFHFTSAWSRTCSFTFDPSRPGAPVITLPNTSAECPVTPPADDSTDPPTVGTIGSHCSFTISPDPGGAVTPTAYVYQLNGGPAHTLGASSGRIVLTPERFTNTLTVTSLSAGANYGDTASLVFDSATPQSAAADGDLTGQGTPDLLEVGAKSVNGLPSGLWMATGQAGPGHSGNGHVDSAATDIGMYGSGVDADSATGFGTPADYDGAIAFTGLFTRDNLQDVLVYYPSGPHAGTGEILHGNGDGSALDAGNPADILSGSLDDPFGDAPLQLADADGVTGDNSGGQSAYPDLIGISGDTTNGYYLNLYTGDTGTVGSYGSGPGGVDNSLPLLTTATPTGGTDWQDWTLASTVLPASSPTPGTALYLWDSATGDLYLWTGLSYDPDTGAFSFTSHHVSTDWNTGASRTLQAADIDGDGTPDLWSTDASGKVTAGLMAADDSGFRSAVTQDTLAAQSHIWDLDEQTDGTVGSTAGSADQTSPTGPVITSASSAAMWSTGDLFSPDIQLNTGVSATTATLTSSAAPLDLSGSFSLSLWAKPTIAGDAIVSQSGTHTAGMKVYADKATGEWYFCMAASDVASPTTDCARGSHVDLGTWTHLTVTYDAANKMMALYVNGVDAGSIAHTPTTAAFNGALVIGGYLSNGAMTAFLDGAVSQLRTWKQVLTPTQVAGTETNGNFTLFPNDSTRYASGSSWTRNATTVAFDQGRLTVTVAGTPMWTKGTATTPAATLSFQTDGNLVAYPDATTQSGALWASNTNFGQGGAMLLQPDGNLVIYLDDGMPVWATGTAYDYADQWTLTSASGGDDAAGLNPSSPSASVTWGPNHKGTPGAAAVFDGSDGVIRATAPAMDTTKSYTVSCWIEVQTLDTTQFCAGQGTTYHQAFYLGFSSTDGWVFRTTTNDPSTTATIITTSAPALIGTWEHLTGVYTAGSGTMQLYLDGSLADTATNTTPQYSPGGPLTIGAIATASAPNSLYNQLTGSVSDVRAYPGALTASQVAALYASS
ncbi:D-mannose binding lectin [Actinacidiphila guanduensis]|uniref:D-mannose binding lectin n=1 Tax=Actinacidiphila guanduensis TaxID=310781 RepID=A0A1H0BGM7_9ACTN|nr:D-mannose binding lectin [Actinacidiphila guanduensis]